MYGSGKLAQTLRRHITVLSPRPFFLRELFKVDEEHGVALGLCDRLKPDPLAGPNQGKLKLKLTDRGFPHRYLDKVLRMGYQKSRYLL